MKGVHVGEFEELILLSIQHLTGEAYGASIQRLLERETTRSVSLGAVYAALDRLEGKGLASSSLTPGAAVRGGRSRRSFTLTARGMREITELRQIRNRLWVPKASMS